MYGKREINTTIWSLRTLIQCHAASKRDVPSRVRCQKMSVGPYHVFPPSLDCHTSPALPMTHIFLGSDGASAAATLPKTRVAHSASEFTQSQVWPRSKERHTSGRVSMSSPYLIVICAFDLFRSLSEALIYLSRLLAQVQRALGVGRGVNVFNVPHRHLRL